MRSFSFILRFILCLLPVCGYADSQSHTILVSLAPYKFFVEKIADKTVNVRLMVPVGASGHTYEPTPKEMLAASGADAWFTIGETFEIRAGQALQGHHRSLRLVDLKKGIDLISAGCRCCAHSQDTHIWLSPRESKIQVRTIADTLAELYPENRALYEKNMHHFLKELDELDQEIGEQLKCLKRRLVMVSHPAYAYFCRDYGLKQLSIEFEGKDPTPQQLTRVIQEARQADIRTIFIQPQYNNKGARLVAKTIGAQVVSLDPYSEDYLNSMRAIARLFAGS